MSTCVYKHTHTHPTHKTTQNESQPVEEPQVPLIIITPLYKKNISDKVRPPSGGMKVTILLIWLCCGYLLTGFSAKF